MRFVLLLTLMSGCAATGPTPSEMLDRSIYTYNQHLRWKRFDKAASFVDEPKRKDFEKTFEDADETLSIDDIEVKDIKFEDEKKAKVTLDTKFFKLPSVTVEKKKWVQVWERRDDQWWLVDNARGPFFPEPASAPTAK